MQRTKIKVGQDYAASTLRNWWEYASGTHRVQVLDTDHWHRWDRYNPQPEDSWTVEDPDQTTDLIEIPRNLQRGKAWNGGSLVLVRTVTVHEDGQRVYGSTTLLETRELVAEWGVAKHRIDAHQEARAERNRKTVEARDRRRAKTADLNARLEALGTGSVGQAFSGGTDGGRWALDESTLELLLTHSEMWRSHRCAVVPERPDDWPEVR